MKNFICLFIFILLSAKNPLIAKEIPKEDQNLEEAVKFAIKSEFLFHNSGVRSELWMWAKDFTREIRCVKLNKRHWLIGVERSSKDYYPVVDVRDLGRFQAFVLQKYGKRGVIKRLPCNIYIFLEDLIDNIAKESYKTYRLRLKEECNITKEKNFAINQKNNKNVKYFKFKLGNAKRKTPHNAEWEKTLKAIEKKSKDG